MYKDDRRETAVINPELPSSMYSSHPADWGEINEQMQAYWTKMGPESWQNSNVSFAGSERKYKHQKRYFSKTHQ